MANEIMQRGQCIVIGLDLLYRLLAVKGHQLGYSVSYVYYQFHAAKIVQMSDVTKGKPKFFI